MERSTLEGDEDLEREDTTLFWVFDIPRSTFDGVNVFDIVLVVRAGDLAGDTAGGFLAAYLLDLTIPVDLITVLPPFFNDLFRATLETFSTTSTLETCQQ